MDRLRAMSGARLLFNGPLRKARGCRGAAAVLRSTPRAFGTSRPYSAPPTSGRVILESPFGPCADLDLTLPDYIWRNVDKWEDKPMIVSILCK